MRNGTMILVSTLLTLGACGDEGAVDGGPVDGGPVDGGPVDGGPVQDSGRATDAGDAGRPRLMWFGAHPDDEVFVAPVLGRDCVDGGHDCRLVVATRGEMSTCGLPSSCEPDLPTVRARELVASAAVFGAELTHWDWGDNTAGTAPEVIEQWALRLGGAAALTDLIRNEITTFAPDRILTFDPRHGGTCHQDHRAISTLVIQVVDELGAAAPRLELVTSRLERSDDPIYVGSVPPVRADSSVWSYDATAILASIGDEAWTYAALTAGAHPSQLYAPAFTATPAHLRRVYFVDREDMVADDPLYQSLCP